MTRKNNGGLSKLDGRLVARFIDGELTADERAELGKRLTSDAVFAAAVRDAEANSRALRDIQPEPLRAPSGFSAAVLEKVRCMPSREDLIQRTMDEEAIHTLVIYGRRLLVAAAVLFAASMLFSFQLFKNVGGKELHADEVTKQMRDLDHQVLELRKREGPLRKR